MRRSTRLHAAATLLSGKTLFPSPYDVLVSRTDDYARTLNILLSVFPLPFDNEKATDGVRLRLQRNRSFLKTDANPNPPELPTELYARDLMHTDTKIEEVIQSMSELQAGRVVMLLQPAKEVNLQQPIGALPICGIMVRFSSSETHDSNDNRTGSCPHGAQCPPCPVHTFDSDRTILGAFCRRGIPSEVADELLRVTLVRTVVEALCYEEVLAQEDLHRSTGAECPKADRPLTSSPSSGCTCPRSSKSILSIPRFPWSSSSTFASRHSRFVSFNTSVFPLCPTVLIGTVCETLRFSCHRDQESQAQISGGHDDDPSKKCKCWKIYYKQQQSQQQSHSSDDTKLKEFYEFWSLSHRRVVSGALQNAVPPRPSDAVQRFFAMDASIPQHARTQTASSLSSPAASPAVAQEPFSETPLSRTPNDRPFQEDEVLSSVGSEPCRRKRKKSIVEDDEDEEWDRPLIQRIRSQ